MADFVLGIDVGTSGVKTLVCDASGKVRAEADSGYPLHSPRPGWNEQDPDLWWPAVVKTVKSLLRAGVKGDQIKAIGLSGQMHGSVFLDAKDKSIRPALLWNDQRTVSECQEILKRAGGEKALERYTLNTVLPGFTSPKILWLRNHEPKNFKRLETVLLPKDYIRLKLTGEKATDVSDASGTSLFNVRERRWSRPLLDRLELDAGLFPHAYESSEITGSLSRAAALELGLSPGVKVVAGAGDQPAAAVGMGVVKAGFVSAVIGTSGVVFAHSETPVENPGGRLQSFCHAVSGKWCVFGCMLTAGGALEWLKSGIFENELSFDEIMKLASTAPAGSRGLFFLPYLDGERCPYPDPYARGAWIGFSRLHGKAEMARALVEGVTYGMGDQMRLMREQGLKIKQVRCSGGGAKSPFWRKLQAEVFGAEAVVMQTQNASAFGAAILGGVGAGFWRSVSDACRAVETKASASEKPSRELQKFYRTQHGHFQRLYARLKPSFQEMARF